MRQWIAALVLLALATNACAATWTVTWHTPTTDNYGTCAVPRDSTTAGGLARHIVVRNGSVLTPPPPSAPGALNTLAQNGASGVYRYIVTESDSLGNLSCPDTLDILIRGGRFSVVTDLTVR